MNSFVVAKEIERNSTGSRIVKVTETGKTPGGEHFTKVTYVVHAPSRLIMVPVRVQGRFTKDKKPEAVMCTADNLDAATGWMFVARFETLAEARQSLGINTSPKRASVIARLELLAA